MNRSRSSGRPLKYEPLESRQMMAVTATLTASGVLNVVGSKKADHVDFHQNAGTISISSVKGSWSADQVN